GAAAVTSGGTPAGAPRPIEPVLWAPAAPAASALAQARAASSACSRVASRRHQAGSARSHAALATAVALRTAALARSILVSGSSIHARNRLSLALASSADRVALFTTLRVRW